MIFRSETKAVAALMFALMVLLGAQYAVAHCDALDGPVVCEAREALESGDVDLVISGMTITPERNARVAFAGPYFISGKSVLTKSNKISNVDNATMLNDSKRTYAALAGSTSETFV